MDITPKHQRNMYAVFIGLFAVNVLLTAWNIREQHKLRKEQSDLTKEQMKNAKNGNSTT